LNGGKNYSVSVSNESILTALIWTGIWEMQDMEDKAEQGKNENVETN